MPNLNAKGLKAITCQGTAWLEGLPPREFAIHFCRPLCHPLLEARLLLDTGITQWLTTRVDSVRNLGWIRSDDQTSLSRGPLSSAVREGIAAANAADWQCSGVSVAQRCSGQEKKKMPFSRHIISCFVLAVYCKKAEDASNARCEWTTQSFTEAGSWEAR